MASVLTSQSAQEDYRQISLNDLLYYYLGAQNQNTQKEKIAQMMRSDTDFWHKQSRPLPPEMLQYAA
jgi:hypothetical protein